MYYTEQQLLNSAFDSSTGALKVEGISGGNLGLAVQDEAAFTAGTSDLTPTGGVFNDTLTDLSQGEEGMVRMSRARALAMYFGMPAATTATWGTGTGLNTALAQSCIGKGTALVTITETGTTTTAGALTFEGYDGANWWPIAGQQINALTPPVSSYALVNNTNVAYQFDIAGFQQFRVRLSTAITGTGTPQALVSLQLNAAPNNVGESVGLAQKLDPINDAITNYPFGHTYTNITTATTTTAKSGAGVLHAITCNTPVASASLTLYDNTAGSGTKMRTITLPATLLAQGIYGVIVDEAFSTGLTAVTVGTADWTLSWR